MSEANSASPPSGAARASAEEPSEAEAKEPESSTTPIGFFLGGSVGLELCYTSSCSGGGRSVGAGPMGTLQVGIRPHRSVLALLAEGSLSAHAFTPPITAGQGGSAWNGSAYLGVRIYPVELGSLTPWVGLLAGFHQYSEYVSQGSPPFDDTSARQLRRIGGRLEVGFDYAVSEHFVLGPYLDWDPMFWGVECKQLGNDAARCTELRDRGPNQPPGAVTPSDQPMFLSFGAQAAWRP